MASVPHARVAGRMAANESAKVQRSWQMLKCTLIGWPHHMAPWKPQRDQRACIPGHACSGRFACGLATVCLPVSQAYAQWTVGQDGCKMGVYDGDAGRENEAAQQLLSMMMMFMMTMAARMEMNGSMCVCVWHRERGAS